MQPLLSLVLLSSLFAVSGAGGIYYKPLSPAQARDVFYNMDLNRDGKVTRFDLQGLAKKGVISDLSAEEISWTWDANGDGIIKNCELTGRLSQQKNNSLPKDYVIYGVKLTNFTAEKDFKYHDKDMDNTLTDKDFEIINRNLTNKYPNFISYHDNNGDGILTLDEYLEKKPFFINEFYFKGQKRRVGDKLSRKEETELFNLLDSNSDGRATKYDIDELIRSGVISNLTGQRILREWDLNNNTIITKMELRKASLTLKATCHSGKMETKYYRDFSYNENLKFFKYLDKNLDNALTAADGNISFFIRLDVNGDGKISKGEYMANKFITRYTFRLNDTLPKHLK